MTKEKQTGSATIPLTKGINISGATIKTLTMREPTVADQLAMSAAGGDPAAQELSLIANLCQVTPADLHQLTLRDYKAVQVALVAFTD